MRTFVIPFLAGLLVPLLWPPASPPWPSPSRSRSMPPSSTGGPTLWARWWPLTTGFGSTSPIPARGYDELYLKRTNVVFRLPPRCGQRARRGPCRSSFRAVWAGKPGQLVCDVITLKSLPNDLDRLDQAVSALAARDFENRKAWAAWAETRGKAFKDNALLQRARSLEAEALRVEAEQKRVTVDAPRNGWPWRRKHVVGTSPSPSPRPWPTRPSRPGWRPPARAARSRDRCSRSSGSFPRPPRTSLRSNRPGAMEPGVRQRPAGRVPLGARRHPPRHSTVSSGPTPSRSCWKPRPPRTPIRRSG